MAEHYFSTAPASAEQQRIINVDLLGRPRQVTVASGVFSSGGLDRGTAVLLELVPPPPITGRFLDLGCGWGPIALTLALHSPAAHIDAVDVNDRALTLTRLNADALGCSRLHPRLPAQIPNDAYYDLIWSNPPIRIGKPPLHELLSTWLPRLAPQGVAYLVVAKALGADSLAAWISRELPLNVERVGTKKGFRVLRVTRARREDAT